MKTRISSELILLRASALFLILVSLYQVITISLDTDFKTDLESKIFLIVGIGFLVYFMTFPRIFFSDTDLYLKYIFRKEQIVSFKDIQSIDRRYFIRGLAYKITYANKSGKIYSAAFFARSVETLSEFIKLVKLSNPQVDAD